MKYLLVILAVIIPLNAAFAQKTGGESGDSSRVFEEGDAHPQMWEFEYGITETSQIIKYLKPSIELNWGLSSPFIDETRVAAGFSGINLSEVRLGFTTVINGLFKFQNLVKYNNGFVFIGNLSNQFISSSDIGDNELESETWRFGFGSASGYGYIAGRDTKFILYHGESVAWSKTDFDLAGRGVSSEDSARLNDFYGGKYNFGDMWEGGAKLKFMGNLSISAAYGRHISFPRHMFWYWFIGEVIEGVSHGVLESFTDWVLYSSPEAGPVVTWVLKNALSYGFYELRANDMNWPFDTVEPLMFNTFKIGLAFDF